MIWIICITALFFFFLVERLNRKMLKQSKNVKLIKMLGHQISNSMFHAQIIDEYYSPHSQRLAYTELMWKDMRFKVSIEQNAETKHFEVTYQLISPQLPQWFGLREKKGKYFILNVEAYQTTFDAQRLPTEPHVWQQIDKITKRLDLGKGNNAIHFAHGNFFLRNTLMSTHNTVTIEDIRQDDSTVKLLEHFVNFCEEMIKQLPRDANTFYLELLEQDDVQHPTFSMALETLLETHVDHPVVIEGFNRRFQFFSDVELLEWLTISSSSIELLKDKRTFDRVFGRFSDADLFELIVNEVSIQLLHDKHFFGKFFKRFTDADIVELFTTYGMSIDFLDDQNIEPLQLLSLIGLCHQSAEMAKLKDYCKTRCVETITARDIERMGPEHIEAREFVLQISLKQPEKLEIIAKNSVKWLSWIKERPDVWVATLVEHAPQYCEPALFLKIIEHDENEVLMFSLSLAFMALIKPAPELLEQPDWAKISVVILPHLYKSNRKAILRRINVHAHASIYPLIMEQYDKSIRKLRSRFERLHISGGLSIASLDDTGGLSMAQQAGDIEIIGEQE